MKKFYSSKALLFLGALFLPLFQVNAAERVALVIGNTIYDPAKPKGTAPNLITAGDDATAMAMLLEKTLAFKVILKTDAGLNDMAEAVDEFKTEAASAKVVLVYFAGHGIESAALGDNFLLPVQAKLAKESHLRTEAYPLKSLLGDLQKVPASTRLIILDCCRNNPLEGRAWYAGRGDSGLAPVDTTSLDQTTMVIFSAAPGKPAKDRLLATDRHSPFADVLMGKLQETGKSCAQIFGEVEEAVFLKTGEQQRPKTFLNGNLAPFTTFVFRPGTDRRVDDAASAARQAALEKKLQEMEQAGLEKNEETNRLKAELEALQKGRIPLIPNPSAPRFNSAPDRGMEQDDQLFLGVKEFFRYSDTIKVTDEPGMAVPFASVASPGRLVFAGIPPNYPLSAVLRFPTLKRACPLPDEFYEAFKEALSEDGEGLKPGWKLQGTAYDFDRDGNPEVVFAANQWDAENQLWSSDMVLQVAVFTFKAPAAEADLDRSANWQLCGTMTGQFVVDLEDDRLILPIGSNSGNDYIFRNGVFLEGSGVGRQTSGRWSESTADTGVRAAPAQPEEEKKASPSPVGTWSVTEEVFPANGGYRIGWQYTLEDTPVGLRMVGRKTSVNGKAPTKGEAAAVCTVQLELNGSKADGAADEVNAKQVHLPSRWKISFSPDMKSFSGANYENGEKVSNLKGSLKP